MTLFVSEQEMINRFADGLKKSAARAKEFLVVESEKKPQTFVDFIDGIKVAAGSAHQLAHTQENPNWLDIRDWLEGVIDLGQNLPMLSTEKTSKLWNQIESNLLNMSDLGIRMARAKPMSRNDVLANLNLRQITKKNMPN